MKRVTVNLYADHLTVDVSKKRKVRKDFDTSKEYSVNVSKCSNEEKKEVQQAFFDVGIAWENNDEDCIDTDKDYLYLDSVQYSNSTITGKVSTYLLYGDTTDDCNMTAKEFLELVYEPDGQGHVHADSMALYAEDAKAHLEPWKLWEYKGKGKNCVWLCCQSSPIWANKLVYRRKPKTHTVNGVEIPDLRIKEAPKPNTLVVLVDPIDERLHSVRIWMNGWDAVKYDRLLELGLIYENSPEGRHAAIMHSKAWLGI